MHVKLNREWSRVLASYKDDHQNPMNRAFHMVGVPMIVASIPVAATVVGIPIAAGLFTVGWTFQFVGHVFEGKKPSFVNDKRSLIAGALWAAEKYRLVRLDTDDDPDHHA